LTAAGADWTERLLAFWFGLDPQQWFRTDPALDDRIRRRFARVQLKLRECPVSSFLDTPRRALAAVILFDQLPRNMFRGSPDQFATDPLALGIASEAIAAGLDRQLSADERTFLYMPYQHSDHLLGRSPTDAEQAAGKVEPF
jgi:uncharacterized protein (DUF924 family)